MYIYSVVFFPPDFFVFSLFFFVVPLSKQNMLNIYITSIGWPHIKQLQFVSNNPTATDMCFLFPIYSFIRRSRRLFLDGFISKRAAADFNDIQFC